MHTSGSFAEGVVTTKWSFFSAHFLTDPAGVHSDGRHTLSGTISSGASGSTEHLPAFRLRLHQPCQSHRETALVGNDSCQEQGHSEEDFYTTFETQKDSKMFSKFFWCWFVCVVSSHFLALILKLSSCTVISGDFVKVNMGRTLQIQWLWALWNTWSKKMRTDQTSFPKLRNGGALEPPVLICSEFKILCGWYLVCLTMSSLHDSPRIWLTITCRGFLWTLLVCWHLLPIGWWQSIERAHRVCRSDWTQML